MWPPVRTKCGTAPAKERIGARYMRIIVPDEAPMPGRLIDEENGADQGGQKQPFPRGEPPARERLPCRLVAPVPAALAVGRLARQLFRGGGF